MELTGNVQGLIDLVGGGSDVEFEQILESGEKIGVITIDDVPTDIYAPDGAEVEVTQVLSSGTKIATIEVDGVSYDLYAPTPPAPTEVDVTPIITSGEHIADIEVNGVTAELYAPTSKIIYSTEERVIGKWLNNEVLYERTFTYDGLSYPDVEWSNNILGTVGSGIEIVEYEGYFGLLNLNSRVANFSYYRAGSEYFTSLIALNNGVHDDISIRPNMNAGARITIDRVTIRYIKIS